MGASDKAWKEYTDANCSVVSRLLHGQLRDSLECEHCRRVSHRFEAFSHLSIEIPTPATEFREVYWIPLEPKAARCKVGLEVPVDGTLAGIILTPF